MEVNDTADQATLTVTGTNLSATTQFKERAKMTERQKRRADKCMTKVRESFTLKKVVRNKANRRLRRSKKISSQRSKHALLSDMNH